MILGFSTILHLLQDHCHKNINKFEYWKDILFQLNFYEFSILDYSNIVHSRNRLFLFQNIRFEDTNVLLKQASKLDFSNISSIKKEAKFYEFIKKEIPDLEKYMSSYYGFDDENFILYRQWENKANALSSLLEELKKIYDPDELDDNFEVLSIEQRLDNILEKSGIAIQSFHQRLNSDNPEVKKIKPFFSPIYPSFIFNFDEQNTEYYANIGGIKFKTFSQYLQSNDLIQQKIVPIIKSWTINCIIHNDFKSSNILIKVLGSQPIIIDWECATLGDSNWDFACLLAELMVDFYLPHQYGASLSRVFTLFNFFCKNPIQKNKIIGFTAIKILDMIINESLFERSKHLIDLAEEMIKEPEQFTVYLEN